MMLKYLILSADKEKKIALKTVIKMKSPEQIHIMTLICKLIALGNATIQKLNIWIQRHCSDMIL